MTKLLIKEFLEMYTFQNQRVPSILRPLVDSAAYSLRQAIHQSEIVVLTPSTTDMLLDKLRHYDETLALVEEKIPRDVIDLRIDSMFHRGTWIRLLKPFQVPDHADPDEKISICALMIFSPGYYLTSTGDDGFHYYLIDENAMIYDVLRTESRASAWLYSPIYHLCQRCRVIGETVEPCAVCEHFLVFFAQLLVIASLITAQYLADKTLTIEEHETLLTRVKRKNSNKTRTTALTMSYRTIDANTLIVHAASADETQHAATREAGESWVQQAEAERDLYRKEITTRPFTRTYKHPRYSQERRENKQEFKEGMTRMQPYRYSRDGKRITNVKSTEYGDE